jgi:energy-coupling factor transporter ATP-binding protein EcfA2
VPTALRQFQIEGLHGRNRTIDIPIRDNRLVLVGENGTGKSTVANLLYYSLTQQWRRIAEYRFAKILVQTADETIQFTHEDVEALASYRSGPLDSEIRHRYPPGVMRDVAKMLAQEPLFLDPDEDFLIDRISSATRTPRATAKRLLMEISQSQSTKLKKQLAEEVKRLESWNFGQFLYLPTYRRIEQDLKSIFRGIEIEEKVREFRDRFRKRERLSFIELIEFVGVLFFYFRSHHHYDFKSIFRRCRQTGIVLQKRES